MPTSTELLTRLPAEHFQLVVAASPKKFREELFRRAGVKNRGGSFTLKTSGKNEQRTQRLYEAIHDGHPVEAELAAELIRNYLYTRRPLLAEALDFFEVAHQDGLTDADLDFLQALPAEKGDRLRELLCRKHDPVDVQLYLDFMNIKHSAS